jgi:hypothetical protein
MYYIDGGFAMIDPATPNVSVTLAQFTPSTGDLTFASNGSSVAASEVGGIGVSNVNDPQTPATFVSGVGNSSYNYNALFWSWSPDSKFIGTVLRAGANQPSLTRIEGTAATTPVAIYPTSSSVPVNLYFQP